MRALAPIRFLRGLSFKRNVAKKEKALITAMLKRLAPKLVSPPSPNANAYLVLLKSQKKTSYLRRLLLNKTLGSVGEFYHGQNMHVTLFASRWKWLQVTSHSRILHLVAVGILFLVSFWRKNRLHCPFFKYSQLAFFILPKKVMLDIISNTVRSSSMSRFSSLPTRVLSSSSGTTDNADHSTICC